METRSAALIKLHSFQRHVVWKYLQPLYRHIRIAEFPKSGGTWICQMVSEMYECPFPRNTHLSMLKKNVQHSHIQGPTNYKTILVVRDVRDVITSAYFHFLVADDKKDPFLLSYWKRIMGPVDISDVRNTMPVFIKKFHQHFKVSRRHINWSDHTESYLRNPDRLLIIKYEDTLKNPHLVLKQIQEYLGPTSRNNIEDIITKYSFKNQTKRNPGDELSSAFLRKGISGDWKNHFNKVSSNFVWSNYGTTMEKLGYA